MFVTSSEDPWQYAGMRQLHNRNQTDMFAYHINCPTCSHCVDLKVTTEDSPEPLQEAFQVFEKQIYSWLET